MSQRLGIPTSGSPIIYMKRYFIALVGLSAFLLLAACGGETATQTPPETLAPTAAPTGTTAPPTATLAAQANGICAAGTLPAYVTDVVLAKDTKGDNFEPVDVTEVYEPTQTTFHAVASLANAPQNLKMHAVWYLVKAKGYNSNTKIDENDLNVEQGGTRNLDFTLATTQKTWPPGSYCVEIYAEGNLALSKTFTVSGSDALSTADVSVVKQVVLAEDADPTTFKPINPTTTFKAGAAFIHATVEAGDAPVNTVFRARWYPPGQDPLDFDLTTDGLRWLDFRLTPTPTGFPTGDYKVEIYVNDKLADTKTFTVE